MAVFPNPVSREKTAGLTVTLQNVSEAHISMTDARGRKVYEQQQKNLLPAAEVALPVSRLSPGVYFLKFQTDRDLFTCKVIVCN